MKNIYLLVLLIVSLSSCHKRVVYDDPIPNCDNFTIESAKLNETRVINVWTPPGYAKAKASLPVLYMLDGGIKEDFPHVANTISKLILSKEIPPIILVGIENTERGRDLTGASVVKSDGKYLPMTDGAKVFRSFMTDELMPEINKNYSTSNKKGIIGESLAGLFVVETFLLQPELFDFYIAFDPSLWWNDHYLVDNAATYLDRFSQKQIKLWFAGSSAKDISLHTDALVEILKVNTSNNLKWKYSSEPNEKHSTIFRATKEKALIWSLKE